MNAHIKKEIRLLRPAFIGGCLLAFTNVFTPRIGDDVSLFWFLLSNVACPLVLIMLALESFGAEVSAGTFQNLLAQPVPREKIWRTKTQLLAGAFLLIGFIWCFAFCVQAIWHGTFTIFVLPNLLKSVVLLGLVIFSGGLWTTLLLRQVAAAFWFTLLIPCMIIVAFAGWSNWGSSLRADEMSARTLEIVFILYSVAGFFFARWLFLRAQDVQWSGGVIVIPKMRRLAWSKFDSGARRLWRPRAALEAKEFQLHQSQFIVAGVLVLLHLVVIGLRRFGHFPANSVTEFFLEDFWALWLVMPLLVGCAAAAEERKLGVLEGQLCLPVRPRTQFAVKAGVVLLLSLWFGVIMPLLLEGPRSLPGSHLISGHFYLEPRQFGWMTSQQIYFWWGLATVIQLGPLLMFAGVAAAIGLISFYASTLSRNTLQSLAPAVLGICLAYFLVFEAARGPEFYGHGFLSWHGGLIYVVGIPMVAVALLVLASRNYQRPIIGWQAGSQNVLALLLVMILVVVTTAAIYHRAWEKLTPFEPRHGPARLALSNPATMEENWGTLSARLPDGRVWTDYCMLNISRRTPLALALGNIKLESWQGGHLYAGSNWVNIAGGLNAEQVGIKTDGTLWVSGHPPHRARLVAGQWRIEKAGDLVRYGTETNWSNFVWDGLNTVLIKTDGTLWRWGTTEWNYKAQEWPGLQTFTPVQLGTDTNWADVFPGANRLWLRKTDGSVWVNQYAGSELERINLGPGLSFERVPHFKLGERRSMTEDGGECWAVLDNGTLRIVFGQGVKRIDHSNNYQAVQMVKDLQLGTETNWLAVAGRVDKVVTLKNDGTLWAWYPGINRWSGLNFDEGLVDQQMPKIKPVRLGTHADWIAIASAEGGIVSLAADGSLWYWMLENTDYFLAQHNDLKFFYASVLSATPWLEISRKPQYLGNVLDGKN